MKPHRRRKWWEALRATWFDLDMFGLLLLSAALTLILIPLTLGANLKDGWKSDGIVAMISIGFVCLIVFPMWESSRRLAPKPLLSLHLLTERTVLAGCALAFFYFSMYHPQLPLDVLSLTGY